MQDRVGRWDSDTQRIWPDKSVAPVTLMFLEPAGQDIGVHAVLQGYCRNGRARLLAGHYQFGLELARVGAVGSPTRISRKV
jgi:hypothetical protein